MSKPVAWLTKRPPASLYVLVPARGFHYGPSDVFLSRSAAVAEQRYAADVYGEKLTLRHYKLQPKGKR